MRTLCVFAGVRLRTIFEEQSNLVSAVDKASSQRIRAMERQTEPLVPVRIWCLAVVEPRALHKPNR